ncbi:TPA: hypothetical protein DEP58_01725 [Patescibacteria group bacterium]|nr:hypothetical protein [Patescibacteria group bacterium]
MRADIRNCIADLNASGDRITTQGSTNTTVLLIIYIINFTQFSYMPKKHLLVPSATIHQINRKLVMLERQLEKDKSPHAEKVSFILNYMEILIRTAKEE